MLTKIRRVMRVEGERMANTWLAQGWLYLNSMLFENVLEYSPQGHARRKEVRIVYVLGEPVSDQPSIDRIDLQPETVEEIVETVPQGPAKEERKAKVLV